MSTTQLIASGVATLAAAVGASYLGVYGTIIGAALMSVMSTAGSAVVKHYLDQGRSQIKDLTHLQTAVNRRDVAERAAVEAMSADPTRTVVWPGGDPNATRLDLRMPGGGDPNATRLDRTPAETVADTLAAAAGPDAVREVVRRSALDATVDWVKQHWVKLVVSSAAIFAIVIGGITLYEATTGAPIGKHTGNGTTISKALTGDGGGSDETPKSPSPTGHSTGPSATPSTSPSGGTSSTGTPTTAPPTAPTGQSTAPTAPTSSAPGTPTAPTNPQPTKSSDGGTGGGRQNDQNDADPNARTTP
ncbi:hypothetical protein [Actinomadura opuntiae]|uniref:hypothetical protein n=1 Tax=Actinomadura sp. OS1-43 TaxID=604315 RepID=UPI00255ABC0E|nr:hypothetical protein [Actinomadura sp. OS1-43]MDL4816046.1 hypothetical protein [Actinomadura sp. OS1-43]